MIATGNPSSEVFYADHDVSLAEDALGKGLNIQPLTVRALDQEPKVEVKAINIDYGSHLPSPSTKSKGRAGLLPSGP